LTGIKQEKDRSGGGTTRPASYFRDPNSPIKCNYNIQYAEF
jgi:hypothetical protein